LGETGYRPQKNRASGERAYDRFRSHLFSKSSDDTAIYRQIIGRSTAAPGAEQLQELRMQPVICNKNVAGFERPFAA
jgi:hypothetical protein